MAFARAPHARAAALAAALVASAGCAGAKARPEAPPAAARDAFEVPGHGALELAVPQGWTVKVEPSKDPPARRTIRLTGPGGAYVALLSPFWNPGEPESAESRVDAVRLYAELARRGALAGSVEGEVPLEELVGDGVHGFWFAVTDRELAGRSPGAGEWRHLLQGVASVGPLVLAFTLLDDAPGPQREQLLDVVRGARYVEGAADRGGDDDEDEGPEADPGASTVPLGVEVPGKPWSVLVDLPGFQMFKPRTAGGVETLVVGHDPERGIVASVIVRAAQGARGAAACRDADLARLRAAHPDLADLRTSGAGGAGAARASYTLPELGGKPVPQLHGHAWLYREDVCANVHGSKAEPGPDDAAALEAILASVRYGEQL